MPRTVASRVAAHRAATERRRAGLPVWDRTVRLGAVFHAPDLTYPQRRKRIVEIIRKTGWPDEHTDVQDLVDALSRAASVKRFDQLWDRLYDLADRDRVWIETHA